MMIDNNNILIISPTYNEIQNIELFINSVLELNLNLLIIDDGSPDGTAQIVKKSEKYNKKLFLIERSHKMGLGSAYREGFSWFLNSEYSHCIEMDVDFSHTFEDLKKILSKLSFGDVVIGSRYIKGGGSKGWDRRRKALSKYANLLSRSILNSDLNDLTSGFRSFNKHALTEIEFNSVTTNGYGFQIEMAFNAEKAGLTILEVPITFEERRLGQSKMNLQITFEALMLLFKLFIKRKK